MKAAMYWIKNFLWWWLAGTVLLIGLSLVLLNSEHTKADFLTSASYDWLHQLSPTKNWSKDSHPLVIVYLDLPSYTSEAQDPTQPWDRSLHAKLLDRLTEENAKLVIMDIIFSGPGPNPESDESLATAIDRNGKVVLAAELNHSSSQVPDRTSIEISHLLLPYQPFLDAGAEWGIAQHVLDDDFAVRSFFPGFPDDDKPSLTLKAARQLEVQHSSYSNKSSAWLNYYGPPLTIPHVSYTEALSTEALKPGFFSNKIVMIGSHPMAGEFGTMNDEFRCPISWGNDSQAMMPGVEIHATQLLNLLNNDLLSRPTEWTEKILFIILPCLLVPCLLLFKPVQATVVSGILQGGLIAGVAGLFQLQQIWFPWMIVAMVQIPGALGITILIRSIDWYIQKRQFEIQKQKAESRIREQARLIDEAHDAILITDSSLNIQFWSRSATALYGWTEEESLNKNVIPLLFHPNAPVVQNMRQQLELNDRWVGTAEHHKKDGSVCQVQCSCSLVQNEKDSNKSWIMIFTDITEAKQLEDQLQRAQRLGLISNLASGMVHDLNNTLSPILLGISRLRRQLPEGSDDQFLHTMETSTQRGIDMVRQILAFSRKETTTYQTIDLNPLLEELRHLLQDTFPKSIHIDFIVPNDLWNISGNPSTIHQILLNLCINARDAMPDGGRLLIACDNVTLKNEDIPSIPNSRPGDFVTIIVEDAGAGMDEAHLKKIFEPFFTTKPLGKGTGLGLSTVNTMLKDLNAFTQVNSQPGEGTSFEIFFPRTTDRQTEKEEHHQEDIHSHEKTVLIIVEEKAVSELLAATIAQNNFHPLVINDGIKAHSISKGNVPFHSAILDMDHSILNAQQIVQALRQSNSEIPIILIGKNLSSMDKENLRGQKNTHILEKPFSTNDFTSIFESASSLTNP